MPLGPSWDIKPLPSHKTTRKPPRVPLFDEIEDPDVGPPPIISNEVRDNPHPTDLEEGLVEKLVKYAAGMGRNYVDDDRIYLEQYLHPERDIIPKQPLRPTEGGMGPSDNFEYRRLPEAEPMKVRGDTLKRYPMTDGLGTYTRSRDNPDYNSAYDVWDFDTNTNIIDNRGGGKSPLASAANWVAKKVMQNVGTPFKVYERYKKDELPQVFDMDYNWIDENNTPAGSDKPLDDWDENNEYIPVKNKQKGKK